MGAEFVQLSLVPLLIAVLAAVACALPGNFLLLRRQALIGDAISHVALPGIVAAFLITGRVSTWPMMLGAAGSAVVAVTVIEAIRRLGRIEPGAAMGVTFTSMFAAGVLLLEQSDTSRVHLDVEHALYGNLESLVWLGAKGWGSLVDPAALAELPDECDRDVHLPAGGSASYDPQPRAAGRLEPRVRHYLCDRRLSARGLRSRMARVPRVG